MTRTVRSTLTYLSGVSGTALTLVIGLIATPLILRWLGEIRLGAFRAASDWAGYASLLELGLGGAMMPLVARAVSRGVQTDLLATLAAGFRAFRGVACVMALGALLLVVVAPRLIPVGEIMARDLRSGLLIVVLGTLLVPLAPLRALLEASQRGYIVNILLTIQSVLITSLALVLAYFQFGITGQFLALFVGIAFTNLLTYREVVKRYPEVSRVILHPQIIKETAGHSAELWKLNGPTLILNICGRVGLMTDNIIIAFFLGPAAVVPFILTQRLATLAQSQLQAVGAAVWAGMSELHNTGQNALFNRRLIDLTRLVATLGAAAMVPIFGCNDRFVMLWVGQHEFAGRTVTTLAAFNGILLAVVSLWGWMFSGTGQIRVLVPVLVVSTVVNLVGSLVGTHYFALAGPLLGTTLGITLVSGWWLPLLLRRHFGLSLRHLAAATFGPAALALPWAIGMWYLPRVFQPRGWLELAIEMSFVAASFLFAAWFIILGSGERTAFKQLAIRLIARRPMPIPSAG